MPANRCSHDTFAKQLAVSAVQVASIRTEAFSPERMDRTEWRRAYRVADD